jgi:hypothetical protein
MSGQAAMLTDLEGAYSRLGDIVNDAMKLRTILRHEISCLRVGVDPGCVAAALRPWDRVVEEMQRLAREVNLAKEANHAEK